MFEKAQFIFVKLLEIAIDAIREPFEMRKRKKTTFDCWLCGKTLPNLNAPVNQTLRFECSCKQIDGTYIGSTYKMNQAVMAEFIVDGRHTCYWNSDIDRILIYDIIAESNDPDGFDPIICECKSKNTKDIIELARKAVKMKNFI